MFIWFMFIVYIVLSVYVLRRMIHWLKKVLPLFKHKRMQGVLILAYVCFASTLIFGGLMKPGPFQTELQKFGNYWLGTFIYIVFFIVLADLSALVLKQIHKKRPIPFLGQTRWYYFIGLAVISASVLFSVYGFLHAHKTVVTRYDITVEKEVPGMDTLKVALLADLHLGYNNGCREMKKMAELVNGIEPDVIVIAGDIFDNNFDALDDPAGLIEILKGMQSRYGTYVVYGNHDVKEMLVGGFSVHSKALAYRDPRMETFLEQCGFTILDDKITAIAGEKIYLVGRLDGKKAGDGTADRRPIGLLTEYLDKSKPILLIDHAPANLKGIAENGVDVMLSGHTHAGQFFPLTLMMPFAWENYHGMKKVGGMISMVTSGVGLYGPNMRVFTDSEVMEINIRFKTNEKKSTAAES